MQVMCFFSPVLCYLVIIQLPDMLLGTTVFVPKVSSASTLSYAMYKLV